MPSSWPASWPWLSWVSADWFSLNWKHNIAQKRQPSGCLFCFRKDRCWSCWSGFANPNQQRYQFLPENCSTKAWEANFCTKITSPKAGQAFSLGKLPDQNLASLFLHLNCSTKAWAANFCAKITSPKAGQAFLSGKMRNGAEVKPQPFSLSGSATQQPRFRVFSPFF